MVKPLDEKSVVEYVENSGLRAKVLGEGDLKAHVIAEGNVNLIFRVENVENGHSVILKQALPYAWRYPDFKMPLDRQRIEYEVLEIEGKYAPEQVPLIYLYDEENHVLVIEDLKRHKVMREALIEGKIFPKVARHVGTFMARTLFYTSDFYLPSEKKKAMVARFMNPVLCKVQEDLVFTEPYIEHPNNRWSKPLESLVKEIYADDELRSEIFHFKELYMTRAQALIHNDLHTGSIMLNEEETKVIDPEFAFFGPMAHDIGTYFANLVIAYAAQEAHRKDEEERRRYREWILGSFKETWNVFEEEFLKAWEKDANEGWPSQKFKEKFVLELLKDTAGFGSAEIFRRTIGMAHVHDFWTIKDETERAKAESIAIDVARKWIYNWRAVGSVDDLVDMIKDSKTLV
ncbi:MAG: 5-methylthioribose kinase [Thermotogota bacterium]|nr:5-methylthioribose kinase [Thermotogota bacterium]MDK2865010.1 5-methylthioribose kinase [Thermotogota bacterium]HCZ07404.1 S-methyl-5-thioribose kinase [Thermotogota bacterium]